MDGEENVYSFAFWVTPVICSVQVHLMRMKCFFFVDFKGGGRSQGRCFQSLAPHPIFRSKKGNLKFHLRLPSMEGDNMLILVPDT